MDPSPYHRINDDPGPRPLSSGQSGSCCGHIRLVIVGLSALDAAVLLLMRVTLSVAIAGPDGLAAAQGWSNADRGIVLGAFFYGYVRSAAHARHRTARSQTIWAMSTHCAGLGLSAPQVAMQLPGGLLATWAGASRQGWC
jgi:hypothetical protein